MTTPPSSPRAPYLSRPRLLLSPARPLVARRDRSRLPASPQNHLRQRLLLARAHLRPMSDSRDAAGLLDRQDRPQCGPRSPRPTGAPPARLGRHGRLGMPNHNDETRSAKKPAASVSRKRLTLRVTAATLTTMAYPAPRLPSRITTALSSSSVPRFQLSGSRELVSQEFPHFRCYPFAGSDRPFHVPAPYVGRLRSRPVDSAHRLAQRGPKCRDNAGRHRGDATGRPRFVRPVGLVITHRFAGGFAEQFHQVGQEARRRARLSSGGLRSPRNHTSTPRDPSGGELSNVTATSPRSLIASPLSPWSRQNGLA